MMAPTTKKEIILANVPESAISKAISFKSIAPNNSAPNTQSCLDWRFLEKNMITTARMDHSIDIVNWKPGSENKLEKLNGTPEI